MSGKGFAPHLCAWCGRNEASITVNLGTVPPATEDICGQCYTEVYVIETQRPRPEAGPQIREIVRKMIGTPPPALLAEYGLWQGAYDALAALRDGGPLAWPHPTLDAISGNPAKALRKFVDLGLLSGPARSQKIAAAPFAITPAGRDVLYRVERGLHKPSWLNRSRLHALAQLVRCGGDVLSFALTTAGVRATTLDALIAAGYVEAHVADGEIALRLADLGREAYEEMAKRPG